MRRGILDPRLVIAVVALATLAGCTRSDKVAGGSSGVDNPQVIVAFVGASGAIVPVSGTLSIYFTDQNPAADPAPLLKRLVNADTSVTLRGLDFKGDSARSYNILLVANDSSGSLLRGLSYDPGSRRFTLGDTIVSSRLDLHMSPLVRYEATLEREGSDLVRVVAPGTPYQAVVVDSVFVIDGVPANDTLTLHLLDKDGQEKPLKNAPHDGPGGGGEGGDKPRHRIDSIAPPVNRPPPPEPQGDLRANAGPDRSVVIGSEFALLGDVHGTSADDPRLAVLWRQIDPVPTEAKSVIEVPFALRTRVTFPWPGFYRFALSAVFGSHRAEDTVLVSVQSPPTLPSFTDPNPFNAHSLVAHTEGPAFKINWYAYVPDTLDLQLSRDTGATWQTLAESVVSNGAVTFWWNATPPLSEHCLLRLRRPSVNKTVAYSTRFSVRVKPPAPPPPPPPPH